MFKKGMPVAVTALVLVMALLASGCGSPAAQTGKPEPKEPGRTLRIGSTVFAETWMLAEMVKLLMEEHLGVKVEHIRNFQGSTPLHAAMRAGELDMYISYTGTQFTGILEMEVTDEWKDRHKIYQFVKDEFAQRFNHHWFEPFGFNNTYILAVREDFAEKNNLKTTSDLVPLAPGLVIGTDQTFQERIGDGYDDFTREYGLTFKEAVAMDYGLMYRAVAHGDVDVIVAYSTDGRIPAMNLALLEDDKGFFPPYDGVLVARMELLQEYPELEKILSPILGTIDDMTMAELNQEVDVKEREFYEVAQEFLKDKGLIK